MDKYRTLKKKTIIMGSMFFAIILALSGVWYILYSQKESGGKDFKAKQQETRKISSEIESIEVKYELASKSIERYGSLDTALNNKKLSISKDSVSALLHKLNDLHRISNLKLAIDNIAPFKQEGIEENPDFSTDFTNINIGFDALSDLHALSFLKAIEDNLEGYVEMSSLYISRENQISRTVLQSFAKGEKPRVITTTVNYVWLGITPTISENTESATQEVENVQ
jgi:hypothetical protein